MWDRLWADVPPPRHQSLFALLSKVPEFGVEGSREALAQHAHAIARLLELGRPGAAAEPGRRRARRLSPRSPAATCASSSRPASRSCSASRPARAGTCCFLHTAGSDGRQYHHLLADPELRARWRMTAFDLPAHGRSTPPSGLREGEWLLNTDRYVEAIVAAADALGLERPVALGCSMGGEICLELAYRHPDRFAAVVACQAADRVEGRQVAWAKHARVNEKLFVPEWVDGLMSPTAPPARRAEVRWAYSQSAHGVYWGDIEFYSREWDARDRVGDIDTAPLPRPHPRRRVRLLVHAGARPRDRGAHPRRAVHRDARARPLPDGRGPRGVPRLSAPGARRDRGAGLTRQRPASV